MRAGAKAGDGVSSGANIAGGGTRSTWAQEALALVRAASGGLLFGIPLLYTMEVWWIGSHTQPTRMLLILVALFAPLVALNTTAGFRKARNIRMVDALEDSLESVAVGLVMTASVLFLLRQITLEMPMVMVLGRVVTECIPFCLGVGVARFLLQGEPGMADDEDVEGGVGPTKDAALNSSAADLGATAMGAAFIGLSIAPTDEVPMLTSGMNPGWLVLVVAASFVISYAVVFVAGFSGQDRRHRQEGFFQHPVTETFITYVVALVVAAVLLWAFQRDLGPPHDLLARVVVLGLPAALGGAVGRLAL